MLQVGCQLHYVGYLARASAALWTYANRPGLIGSVSFALDYPSG